MIDSAIEKIDKFLNYEKEINAKELYNEAQKKEIKREMLKLLFLETEK